MYMYFSRFLEMLLVTTPRAFVLSIFIGVGNCVCPISYRAWHAGMYYFQLMKSAPSSASAADDMTALMILAIVNTATLLGGNSVLFDMKKYPPDLLLGFVSERYEASLWPARTISLAWYVSIESGWVSAYYNDFSTFYIVCSIGFA